MTMNINYLTLTLSLLTLMSCDGFLDEKPESSLLVPDKLSDLEQLLDGTTWGMNNTPGILEISTDNLYTNEQGFLGLTLLEQNAYTWQKEIYEFIGGDWNVPYQQILTANVVLNQADQIHPDNQKEIEFIREFNSNNPEIGYNQWPKKP